MDNKFNCPYCRAEQEWKGQDKCRSCGGYFSNWFKANLKRVTGIVMIILASANGWIVSWEAHKDNVAVVVVTECDNPAFVAYNRQDVDAKQNRATFIRHRVPKGAKCFVTAMLMRNTDVNPEGYAAEVAYTSQEE